jgi:alginate O-acetyltransferase complex protein AlgJ
VAEGREGWLFLQNDTNDVVGQHEGRVTLGGSASSWASLFQRRVEVAKRLGFAWACEIAPDKQAVYPELAPAAFSPAPSRPVHDVLDLGEAAGADTSYLLDDLLAVKDEAEVYPRIDTHWNHLGSYAAYLAICRRLRHRGIEVPAIERSAISWETTESGGDLGSKLEPRRTGPIVSASVPEGRGRLVADNRVQHTGRVIAFENSEAELPSCVVFGESFAYHLLVFLAESFRRVAFVHTSALIEEVIAAERPDVVVSVPTERFLIRPPEDEGALRSLHRITEAKLAENRLVMFDPTIDLLRRGNDGPGRLANGELPW